MISTWLDLFVALSPVVTGFAGYLLGRAAARHEIIKREAARRDLAAELRSHVDLEQCEFTRDWEVRR
ncbi:hypothetical protein [Aquamicrobium terrae]|uniref:Uncharacterized protein n=1 Tax=Aquamicrobium terrae TaxID=1324945 RepID=A0ABV2MV52_9HYPH